MKNRHGVEYSFVKYDDNLYRFNMSEEGMKYMRYGGKDYQEGIDYNDLGMFDPSGGPYVGIGSLVEGRVVEHIRSADETFIVKVA